MAKEDFKKVFVTVEELKEEGVDIRIPIKILTFTGVRNRFVYMFRVENIN